MGIRKNSMRRLIAAVVPLIMSLAIASSAVAQSAAPPAPSGATAPASVRTATPAASAPTPAPAPAAAAGSDDVSYPGYILGSHDTLGVSVVGRTDFNTQVTVQEDGTISLPLIGQIAAA